MSKIAAYIKESRQELTKVIWPSKRELTNHAVLVIGVSLVLAAFIGVVDYVFQIGFEQLLRLRS